MFHYTIAVLLSVEVIISSVGLEPTDIPAGVSEPSKLPDRHSCGIQYGLPLHFGQTEHGKTHIYYLNSTADDLERQGFSITVGLMFSDAIYNFTFTNGSYTATKSFSAVGGLSSASYPISIRSRAYYMGLIGKTELREIKWLCEGTLISDQWVLSAAHCFQQNQPDIVRLGEFKLKSIPRHRYDNRPQDFEIVEIKFHPLYKLHPDFYDLVLIKLSKPIAKMQHSMNPICLPWDSELHRKHIGSNLTMTGWQDTPLKTGELQEKVFEVLDQEECTAGFQKLGSHKRTSNAILTTPILCARTLIDDETPCPGDSGSPLAYQNENGNVFLAAIVSGNNGCHTQRQPARFTAINTVETLDWIKQVAFDEQ